MLSRLRMFLVLMGLLVFAAAAAAAAVPPELSARPPAPVAKPLPAVKSMPPVESPRQGGDTIVDAVTLSIPVEGLAGTTAGYNDDYDEVCPYTQSTSPDVVYTFVAPQPMTIDIDMFGSSYDTKIYVYDSGLALVACNDDFYSDYVSKLEDVPVTGGERYYLVIDGYGGDFGDYLLSVREYEPCHLEVGNGTTEEMEPPLVDDYVDWHNGGCNTDNVSPPLQPLGSGPFHGRSGWFLSGGTFNRDTDWFTLTVPYGGFLEIVGDAEFACYLFELGPLDCDAVGVIQNVALGPCLEGVMVITGAPGSTVWVWVGPTVFEPPDGFVGYEFDYVLDVGGGSVVTEDHTWGAIRDLYR